MKTFTFDLPDGYVFDEEKHEYSVAGKIVPSVTQIIKSAGIGNMSELIPLAVLEKARERGSHVHKITAAYDLNMYDIDTFFNPTDAAMLIAWDDCVKKIIPSTWEEIGIEVPFVSESGYAGTMDRLYKRHDHFWILDIKTGSTIDNDYVGMQLAGYANKVVETFDLNFDYDKIHTVIVWFKFNNGSVSTRLVSVDWKKYIEKFAIARLKYFKNK